MNFDAFSEGIEPGGLRNTKDIGILICYMMTYIAHPFTKDDIVSIVQSNGIANYFETTAAVSELIKCGNIRYTDNDGKMIEITDAGKLISQQLSSELSVSVRQKAVTAILKLARQRKIEQENPVVITHAPGGGYNVNIRITDGIRDLMSLTLFVPDRIAANTVKNNFYERPEKLYNIMLAAAVGEKNMVDIAVKELENGKQDQ